MSEEDRIAMALVDNWESDGRDVNVTYESHYNHYGNRGYVDLVLQEEVRVTLYEVKSRSAVENATGANEIIRQATKHANYYFESNPCDGVKRLTLAFEAHPNVWDHLVEHLPMYREFRGEINNVWTDVALVHPDCAGQLKPCHPKLGYHTDRWGEQFKHGDIGESLREAVGFEGVAEDAE